MYYPALLILNNYIPKAIELGMLFKTVLYPNTDREFIELWSISDNHVRFFHDIDAFCAQYGYPVEVMIIDEDGETLAHPDQIGWWDEGKHTDELRDITLTDINRVIKEQQGNIEIEISSDAYQIAQVVPIMSEGKVILRIPTVEDDVPSNETEEEY